MEGGAGGQGGLTSSGGYEEEMRAQVQLESEMLELLAEGFSDCSPECVQVVQYVVQYVIQYVMQYVIQYVIRNVMQYDMPRQRETPHMSKP